MLLFNPFQLFEQYNQLFFGWFYNKPDYKKVTHLNAKFKVVKTTHFEETYYSNASTEEKAREEGWTAIGLHKDGIKKGIRKVDLIVIENPHRVADRDHNDFVTGLPVS